jgi:hypothetical protein
MSNAKGTGIGKASNQVTKVTATSRSEANAVAQDLRRSVQKAVAMPAAAVRAAMAQNLSGAVAAKVAYDVLSRFLSLIESGVAIDKAMLKTTKAAIDTAHSSDGILYKKVTKAFNDISHLNDVLVRVVSYNRTFAEATHSVDQPAKKLSKTKPDTAHSSDARTVVLGKLKSESLQLSENFAKVVSFKRLAADPVTLAELALKKITKGNADTAALVESKTKTIGKPKVETINLAELKKLNFGKVANEILSTNDARRLLFTKKINDFISVLEASDVRMAAANYGNSGVDLGHIADQLSRLVSFVRLFSDAAKAQETTKRTLQKRLSETPRATDRVTHVMTFNRLFTDTSHSTDVFKRVISYNRTKNDVARSTDAANRTVNKGAFVRTATSVDSYSRKFTKAKADIGRATDSFSRLVTFNRSFNSTATSTHSIDVVALVKSFNRTFTEVPKAADTFVRYVSYKRFYTDTSAAADSFSKVVTYNRSKQDISTALDAFAKVVEFNRTKSDASTASDSFSKVLFAPRLRQDTSRATDLITAKVITKRLESLLRASDDMRISSFNHPGTFPPADRPRVADQFRKFVSFIRSVTDVAKAQETISKSQIKSVGDSISYVWEDYNETSYILELLQGYTPVRTDKVRTTETTPKTLSKRIPYQVTYYPDSTWTDYNELSLGTEVDQELVQEAWNTPYTLDSDLARPTDIFTKVVNYSRPTAEVMTAPDEMGKQITRTVGDNRSNTFNDFADIAYSNEYYSGAGGYGATITITNNYPTYTVSVTNAGYNYTVGQPFSILVDGGEPCSFTVATINGNGGILTVTGVSGKPPVVATTIKSGYWNDFAELTMGLGTLDQYTAQYNGIVINYVYPGPFAGQNVGPAVPLRRSVIGQDLLFTTTPRSDGDSAKGVDAVGKTITKDARIFVPQGFWNDFADLTFGNGSGLDQELIQNFVTSKPESVSVVGAMSVATLGPTKRNRDEAFAQDATPKKLSKGTFAEPLGANETFAKFYAKSAGKWTLQVWNDFVDYTHNLLEMSLDNQGNYELILLPETLAKNVSKQMVFPQYVWRDYNELTFGSTNDQELVVTWASTDSSDISMVMDDARRSIQPNKSDTISLGEDKSKEITLGAIGDSRNPSTFRDYLGLFPVGYTGSNAVQDEELLLKLHPGDRTDFAKVADAAPKLFTKVPVITVKPFWSDFNDLTFGTTYDQDLLQFQDTIRPETSVAADLFRRVFTANRTFADAVMVKDSMLLSVNGGPLFTLIDRNVDVARSAETQSRFLLKGVGNVKSYYSNWYDFAELEAATELAQYYSRPIDSTLDTGKLVDVKKQTFYKQAGRVQNILDYFDTDLFYDRDLVQQFANDYVTEIGLVTDNFIRVISPKKTEVLNAPDEKSFVITKSTVGDTSVSVWADYLDLWLADTTNKFPTYKIDTLTVREAHPITYTKAAGSNFYRIFDDFFGSFVYSELEELDSTPYRNDIVSVRETFTRTFNAGRTKAEPLQAADSAPKTLSKGTKAEQQWAHDTSAKTYTKVGGANVFNIWSDFAELDPQLELAQHYPDYRLEYLKSIDVRVNKLTKARSDIALSADAATLKPNKGLSETPTMLEGIGKFANIAQVGNSTLTSWYDSNEITSYDPTLMTYGQVKTIRFDKVTYSDTVGRQFNKTAGKYKTSIWTDFLELDSSQDLAQYYPPYVTEMLRTADGSTRRLNKGLSENPVSADSGTVRVFDNDSYFIDSSPYYAEDYMSDGITTSTF